LQQILENNTLLGFQKSAVIKSSRKILSRKPEFLSKLAFTLTLEKTLAGTISVRQVLFCTREYGP